MADFALRINFVDVIEDGSLEHIYVNGRKMGYRFRIRLSYYRGHFLSVIDTFQVRVDGEEVPNERVKFCINGKAFSPCEFDKCYTEFWNVIEPAAVCVFAPGGLSEGLHEISVTLLFRSPYMPIGPEHQYMPVDSSGTKTLRIHDAKEGAKDGKD